MIQEKANLLERWQMLMLAFAVTDKALIQFLTVQGFETFASGLSSLVLYATTVLSILMVITKKGRMKKAIVALLAFGGLYLYQYLVLQTEYLNQYWSTFFITALGGILCGLTIHNPKSFIRYTGRFSFAYGLFLIPEPFTQHFLHYTSMSTGYTLAPLVIFLSLYWYFSPGRHRWIILLVAVPLGITTILFTSRGCGLAIIVALFSIKLIDNKRKHVAASHALIGAMVLMGAIYVSMTLLGKYFARGGGTALMTGSALNKFINGVLSDDNGRVEIWENAWSLFKEHWILGVGMGMDRQIVGYVFPHNVIVEILLHFGLFVGIILILVYWRRVIHSIICSNANDWGVLIITLCSAYWVRLLFSDTYLNNMFGIMIILGIALQMSPWKERL